MGASKARISFITDVHITALKFAYFHLMGFPNSELIPQCAVSVVRSWSRRKTQVGFLIGEKTLLTTDKLPVLPVLSSLLRVNIFSPYFLPNMTVIFFPWFHGTNLHLRCIFWDLGSDGTGIASLNRAPYASFCVCLPPAKPSQIISLAEYMTKYQKGVTTQMLTLLQKGRSDKCFPV